MSRLELKSIVFLYLTMFLSIFALWGVVPISYAVYLNDSTCPMLGALPACYLVTISYLFILISSVIKKPLIFLVGWLPIFLLAITGSAFELFGKDVCPKTTGNIPMCYLSLVFSIIIAILFFGWWKIRKNN